MVVHALNKKVVTTVPISPERQALATEIEAAARAECAAENGRAAVARALELVNETSNKLVEANAAVISAKEDHTAAIAVAIGKGTPVPSSTLKIARTAQAEAQDNLDAAAAALERLQTACTDLEAETSHAKMRVEAAINAVLAAAGFPLVRDLLTRRAEVLQLLSILCFIRNRGRERQGTSSSFRVVPMLSEPLAAVESEINAVLEVGVPFNNFEAALAHPVLNAWQEACAALRADASAPLPHEF